MKAIPRSIHRDRTHDEHEAAIADLSARHSSNLRIFVGDQCERTRRTSRFADEQPRLRLYVEPISPKTTNPRVSVFFSSIRRKLT